MSPGRDRGRKSEMGGRKGELLKGRINDSFISFFIDVLCFSCVRGGRRCLKDVYSQITMSPGRDKEGERVIGVVGKEKVMSDFLYFLRCHGCSPF